MKKKKIGLVIIFFVVMIIGTIIYKLYYVNYYNEITLFEEYNVIKSTLNDSELLSINTVYYDEEDYVVNGNISLYIGDDYTLFSEIDSASTYVSYDTSGDIDNSIIINSIDNSYLESINSSVTSEFFNDNGISNDYEFFEFLKTYNVKNPSLLVSVKEMDINYTMINFLLSLGIEKIDYQLTGDYEGIVYSQNNSDQYLTVINIFTSDKVYMITLVREEECDTEYLLEVINSINIK